MVSKGVEYTLPASRQDRTAWLDAVEDILGDITTEARQIATKLSPADRSTEALSHLKEWIA